MTPFSAHLSALGLAPGETARLLDVSPQTVSYWISGTRTRDGVSTPAEPPRAVMLLLEAWRGWPEALGAARPAATP